MSVQVVFQQMVMIFLLIAIGYILYKKHCLNDETSRTLSWIVVNVTNPALIISSVMEADPVSDMSELFFQMLVSLIVYIAVIFLGYLLPLLFGVKREERGFYSAMTVYPNTGFMGIPVISAVLGNQAMIYIVIYNIFFTIFFYSHGITVLAPQNSGEKVQLHWKNFINVGMIASLAALFLFIFQIKLPAVLSDTCTYCGKATTFLAMLVLGMALARFPIREIFSDLRLLLFSLVRMIALPVLAAWILTKFTDQVLFINCITLLLAMPGANLPLMYCQQKGEDADVLAKGIALSSLISIVTITLVSMATTGL